VGPREWSRRPRGDRHSSHQADRSGNGSWLPASEAAPGWRWNANRGPDHKETKLLMAEENLRSAHVNDADLAEIVGHRVETMLACYTQALGKSFAAARNVVEAGT
jgi:hypothetical protein